MQRSKHAQRPKNPSKTKHDESRGQRDQEGGTGQGGQGQVRAGSSGQAGNVSLWRGANRLGAALLGFSFKHHDSGLETEENKNKETGLGLPPSCRESSSSLRFAGSSAECPSSIFQQDLLGRLGPQLHGRGSWSHFTEEKTEAQSGNVTPQSHTGSVRRTRLRISDLWAMCLPLTMLSGDSGARLGHGSAQNTLLIFKNFLLL